MKRFGNIHVKDNVGRKLGCDVHEGVIPGDTDILRGPVLTKAANINQEAPPVHRVGPTIRVHRVIQGRLTTLNDADNAREFHRLGLPPEGRSVVDIHIRRNCRIVEAGGAGEVLHVLDQGVLLWDRIGIVTEDVVALGKEDPDVKGMGLPLILLNPDDPQLWITLLHLVQNLRCLISAPIVHD